MMHTKKVSAAGLLRLAAIVGPHGLIPISKSSWWAGVRSGRFPPPRRLGARTVAWRASDIEALIENGVSGGGAK
jgi:predicted DNA-binding transcriptional regulator AlpA